MRISDWSSDVCSSDLLCVGYVHVPQLRGRHGQIRKLVNVFVAEQNHCQCRQVVGFDARALELLLEYDWPGNIRELHNVVEATFVNAEDRKSTRMNSSH